MSKHINKATKNKANRYTGLPMCALNGAPILQMFSEKEVIIEGAECLVYYDETVVKIRTKKLLVTTSGRGLSIKCLANDNIAVCGMINNINLEHI